MNDVTYARPALRRRAAAVTSAVRLSLLGSEIDIYRYTYTGGVPDSPRPFSYVYRYTTYAKHGLSVAIVSEPNIYIWLYRKLEPSMRWGGVRFRILELCVLQITNVSTRDVQYKKREGMKNVVGSGSYSGSM